MPAIVPPSIAGDSSPGERAAFAALASMDGADDWVILHAVEIADHSRQRRGEADFVIVVPYEGLLVVEVKGHSRVRVDDEGLWRLGDDMPTRRSPYDQAAGNADSVREFLRRHQIATDEWPIATAVWFTSIARADVQQLPAGIGIPADATLDADDLESPRLAETLTTMLRTTDASWQRKQVGHYRRDTTRPSPQEVRRIREALRPSFDIGSPKALDHAARERALDSATQQQEWILDLLDENAQLHIHGPAGSGKSHVAIRAAKRAANRDHRVLFTVFNRLLEAELRRRVQDDQVEVQRIHRIMQALTGLEPPAGADDRWWNETLPAATLAVTRAPGFQPPFDYLVADEAQDLARNATLDVLDSLLVGGLAGAPSVIVGDYIHQSIFQRGDTTDLKALVDARVPHAAKARLRINVRNTPELADFFERLTGEELYTDIRRVDDAIESAQIARYESEADQQDLLASALQRLADEGWSASEIVVLAPKRDSAAARAVASGQRGALSPNGLSAERNQVRWGTIHAFKGLEAPAVILTDVERGNPYLDDLLYVGITRATDRLIVLTDDAKLVERAGTPAAD